MKALISPSEQPIEYIASWTSATPPNPIYQNYPNSCRVAQVEPNDQTFPVGGDLFWTDCADNIIADKYYYDTIAQTINIIVNQPAPNQPIATGTTTI
jgi:hypothetical protein